MPRRGRAPALPARRASAVPGGGRRGGSRPPTLPLVLLLPPSPQPALAERSSRREGGDFLFSYARGFAPCIPGAEPARHWFALPLWKTQWGGLPRRCRRGGCQRYPAGGVPALPPAYPAFRFLFCPLSPRPPSPVGKGEIFCFLMQGASPLASPGLNPGGTGYPRPGGEDHLKRRSSSPPVPPLLGCRHCPWECISVVFAPSHKHPFAGYLHGGNCKCRKRFDAGVPGAAAPGEINL